MYNKSSLPWINSFASEQGDSVPTSEQVFVLTGSQLQQIIESAIVKATEPLMARIESIESELEMRAYAHSAKVESMTLRIEALRSRNHNPNSKIDPRS